MKKIIGAGVALLVTMCFAAVVYSGTPAATCDYAKNVHGYITDKDGVMVEFVTLRGNGEKLFVDAFYNGAQSLVDIDEIKTIFMEQGVVTRLLMRDGRDLELQSGRLDFVCRTDVVFAGFDHINRMYVTNRWFVHVVARIDFTDPE